MSGHCCGGSGRERFVMAAEGPHASERPPYTLLASMVLGSDTNVHGLANPPTS